MTETIVLKRDLAHVRERPTMYTDSVNHAYREAIDNVADEFQAGACKWLGIHIDTAKNTMIVADAGRGFPVTVDPKENLSAFAIATTKLNSSGKFSENRETNKYKIAGGLHGVGLKVAAGISDLFEAWTKRDGGKYKVTVEKGIHKRTNDEPIPGVQTAKDFPKDLPFTDPKAKVATIIKMTPDPSVFGAKYSKLDVEYFHDLCYNLQYLCPGLTIELIVNTKREVFYNEQGIKGLLLQKCKIDKDKGTDDCEEFSLMMPQLNISMWWNVKEDYETIISYVNGLRTKDDGKHVDGFRKAVTAAFGDEGTDLARFLKEGLRCAIHVKIENPQFQGQNKHRLVTPEADELVRSQVERPLKAFLDKHKDIKAAIIEKAIALKKVSDSYKKDREALKALAKTRARGVCLPDKLITAPNCSPEEREIFYCEGDSASGPIIKGRTKPLYQEVYKLKGKMTNASKADLKAIVNNPDIKGIIQSIGCGIGDECNVKKIRAHKLILIPDADVDGCLVGSTRVPLLDGTTPTMEELTKRFPANEKFYVYSVNPKTGEIVPGVAHSPRITKYVKTLVRVTLDSGETIDCTENHPFLQTDGTFIRSEHLTTGASLYPFKWKTAIDSIDTENIVEYVKTYNHHVVKVEIVNLEEEIPVYDLTVDTYHNFALDCGIFVHNSHITALLTTFFIKYMKPVVESGMLYRVDSPLFMASYRDQHWYGFGKNDEAAKKDILSKIPEKLRHLAGTEALPLNRFKGHGAANPEEIRAYALDPATRRLRRLTIGSPETEELVMSYMGSDTSVRKEILGIDNENGENNDDEG